MIEEALEETGGRVSGAAVKLWDSAFHVEIKDQAASDR